MLGMAEYIWIDGAEPTPQLRSKGRVVLFDNEDNMGLEAFPEWSFDGSSTNQAVGSDSDCILKPVNFVGDPFRGPGNYLVMCEVFNTNGTPHRTNTRAILREILDAGGEAEDMWVGFEQEYTLFQDRIPLGWPKQGYPTPQGPYYCSVGSRYAYGRTMIEEHAKKCIDAGLMFYGLNAEVMPGQWEFQVGYRGLTHETADPLNISDHRIIAIWMLHHIGEKYKIAVDISNKPVKGDWNGAGCHTNFSTGAMRDPQKGAEAITKVIAALQAKHDAHIKLYGFGLGERLTGKHETAELTRFSAGVSDRGASIRIPPQVEEKGCGYLEDRRPGANSDPYLVCARLLATIGGFDDSSLNKF